MKPRESPSPLLTEKTYCVDPSASGDGADGSEEKPFKSVAQLYAHLSYLTFLTRWPEVSSFFDLAAERLSATPKAPHKNRHDRRADASRNRRRACTRP